MWEKCEAGESVEGGIFPKFKRSKGQFRVRRAVNLKVMKTKITGFWLKGSWMLRKMEKPRGGRVAGYYPVPTL